MISSRKRLYEHKTTCNIKFVRRSTKFDLEKPEKNTHHLHVHTYSIHKKRPLNAIDK